jgi:hypothetical protein
MICPICNIDLYKLAKTLSIDPDMAVEVHFNAHLRDIVFDLLDRYRDVSDCLLMPEILKLRQIMKIKYSTLRKLD